jgi:hypothetical protein
MPKGRIISFGWTWTALAAGAKTRTRRDWVQKYADKFHKGDICQAWTKAPYANGHYLCQIQLTEEPYQQSTKYMRFMDYHKEGFYWMFNHQDMIDEKCPDIYTPEGFINWQERDEILTVIDFRIVPCSEYKSLGI